MYIYIYICIYTYIQELRTIISDISLHFNLVDLMYFGKLYEPNITKPLENSNNRLTMTKWVCGY